MRPLILLVMLSTTVQAQPLKEALAPGQPPTPPMWFKEPPERTKDGKTTIPLTLTPAGFKKPLSRYYLTPQYSEMKPGNRVQTFMKAVMEQQNFFSGEQSIKRDWLYKMAIEDLPLDVVKETGCVGGLAYRPIKNDTFQSRGRPLADIDEGARQLTSDWQIWFNIREDGIYTLLPEVQKLREHATSLKLRMRHEIRTGEIDKAIYTARTFSGLATSLETNPTLIASLVGVAIQTIGFSSVEELMQHPECPNLYWSFTEMPADVLNMRLASQSERTIYEIHLPGILNATGPLADEEISKQLKILEVIGGESKGEGLIPNKLLLDAGIRSTDQKKLDAARKRLIESGMKPQLVSKFTDLQLIVTSDIVHFQMLLDEMMLAFSLPHPTAMKHLDGVEKSVQENASRITKLLMPAIRKITISKVRLKQYLAYLRTIEAIRLYAHEHDGQLPAKLADCSVPLPLDPVTEKPFEYSVKDSVATLHGGNPSPNSPQTNRYYEIRIKK